jgi:hypothetical protein
VILTSVSFPVDTLRSNSVPSDTTDTNSEKSFKTQTVLEHYPNDDSYNTTMVVVTSPSFNSDLSSEQNDSIDDINPSSLSFLHTKQRRIDHRRNKSEPVTSANLEDAPSTPILELSLNSTTSNDSPLSNNTSNESKRKSSANAKQITQEKSSPSTTTATRKKKPWYNVSTSSFYYYHFKCLFLCYIDQNFFFLCYDFIA